VRGERKGEEAEEEGEGEGKKKEPSALGYN
jgi:hypothetical protein